MAMSMNSGNPDRNHRENSTIFMTFLPTESPLTLLHPSGGGRPRQGSTPTTPYERLGTATTYLRLRMTSGFHLYCSIHSAQCTGHLQGLDGRSSGLFGRGVDTVPMRPAATFFLAVSRSTASAVTSAEICANTPSRPGPEVVFISWALRRCVLPVPPIASCLPLTVAAWQAAEGAGKSTQPGRASLPPSASWVPDCPGYDFLALPFSRLFSLSGGHRPACIAPAIATRMRSWRALLVTLSAVSLSSPCHSCRCPEIRQRAPVSPAAPRPSPPWLSTATRPRRRAAARCAPPSSDQ